MVVDSSIWVEFFSDGPLAETCFKKIKNGEVYVPAIVIYEVYRKFVEKGFTELAMQIVAYLAKSKVIEIDQAVALAAADISIEHKLPMADSLVYACAQLNGQVLLTLDHDFLGLPQVELLRK